ncbi:MAG: PH domain-containing protein [Candidatus Kapabacteria bacterium]|nr:PH domain-containing protein [Ignavibacteriota bacterium]MCW5883723.1 PH domain-containing protein [Candidatus Kapabacteria bacterium]
MGHIDHAIETAKFNPNIKTYLLLYVGLILFSTIIGIPLLLIWFLGFGQYVCQRYYENLTCNLTERHLEFRKGYLFRVEKTIPLDNIQDLTFIENPLLKIFDLRILKIETAGQSNPAGSDMKLIGIIDTYEFKTRVLNQRDSLQNRNSANPEFHNMGKSSNEILIEIRDLLMEIRDKN